MKKLLLLFLAFGLLQGYARQRFLEGNFKNQHSNPFRTTTICLHNTGLKTAHEAIGDFQINFPSRIPAHPDDRPEACGLQYSKWENPGSSPVAESTTPNKINKRYIAPIPFDKMPGDPERTQNPGF